MLDWSTTEYIMLALLAPLILASGFFSGSETALFGLSETERVKLTRGRRVVASLLSDRRQLLVSILLGNMTVNVLYFVVSSVLLMRTSSTTGEILVGVVSLLGIVLFGEVIPKMLASARRISFARVVAPVLYAVHQAITPLRLPLTRLLIVPLNRLTAPATVPPRLSGDELQALLELSSGQGVIDLDEQRLIGDVLDLSRRKVRDVMTPRVRLAAITREADRADVLSIVRARPRTRLPVYEGDMDHVVGVLHVKRYLADPMADRLDEHQLSPPTFVPEIASLEGLLDHFRRTHTKSALVVDEYGGTAGLVSIEDVVEELVGDIAGHDEVPADEVQAIGINIWRVPGDMSVHDWADAFGQRLVSPRVSTIGGLVLDRLGRLPEIGDAIEIGNLIVTVDEMDRSRVAAVIMQLHGDEDIDT